MISAVNGCRSTFLTATAARPSKGTVVSWHRLNSSSPASTAEKRAQFEIISPGIGSLLTVTLKKNQKLKARPHSIIGLSGTAKSKIQIPDSTLNAALRRLRGGPFFVQEVSSGEEVANVLIAPHDQGDISTIDLPSGTSGIVCHPKSFLACTGDVDITASIHGIRVYGNGSLALSSYGRLHRLSLKTGEEYNVSPHNLIAYSSKVKPQTIVSDVEIQVSDQLSFVQLAQQWALQTIRRVAVDPVKRVRLWILGDKNAMMKLVGPGEYFISSRTRPRLGMLTGALAEMQYQGELLKESWRDGKEKKVSSSTPGISVESISALGSSLPSESETDIVKVVVTNGKVLFSNPKPSPSHQLNQPAKQSTAEKTATEKPEQLSETKNDAIEKTATLTEKKPTLQKKSTWRTLLFGHGDKK